MFDCRRDERDSLHWKLTEKGCTNLLVAEVGPFSCLSVCMNTEMSTILIPRDNKFGMSVTV